MSALPPLDQSVRRTVYRWFVERGHAADARRIAVELGANRLDSDWRRPTAAEAESIFTRLGLTSSFWSLAG